jgi:hypothetical protein
MFWFVRGLALPSFGIKQTKTGQVSLFSAFTGIHGNVGTNEVASASEKVR